MFIFEYDHVDNPHDSYFPEMWDHYYYSEEQPLKKSESGRYVGVIVSNISSVKDLPSFLFTSAVRVIDTDFWGFLLNRTNTKLTEEMKEAYMVMALANQPIESFRRK